MRGFNPTVEPCLSCGTLPSCEQQVTDYVVGQVVTAMRRGEAPDAVELDDTGALVEVRNFRVPLPCDLFTSLGAMMARPFDGEHCRCCHAKLTLGEAIATRILQATGAPLFGVCRKCCQAITGEGEASR